MSVSFPKPQRLESPAYLRFIRNHQCIVTRCWRKTQAHHVVFEGQGRIGSKTTDYQAIPLCERHHQEYHQMGRVPFEDRHAVLLDTIVRELLIEYVAQVNADRQHALEEALNEYADPENWMDVRHPRHPDATFKLVWNHKTYTEGPDLAKNTLEELEP